MFWPIALGALGIFVLSRKSAEKKAEDRFNGIYNLGYDMGLKDDDSTPAAASGWSGEEKMIFLMGFSQAKSGGPRQPPIE